MNTKDTVNVTNDYGVMEASKVWDDNNNQDGKRQSVTFKLMSSTDGQKFTDVADSEKTVGTENQTVTWTGLPAADASGKKLTYKVAETGVPAGYTSEVTGTNGVYTVTNTHVPEITEIIGTKIWDDNYNQDGKRPQSITVALKADGVQIDTTTASSPNWTYSFTDLPKYSNGHLITYAVEELNTPEGYVASVDVSDQHP